MTWSLIARDDRSGRIGLAAASRFFALGARIPFLDGGVGAVASQALVNPLYGRKGLDLLRQGCSARQTVEALVADDAGREARQVHVMDNAGTTSAFTGIECVDWCGHMASQACSAAGNMLSGPAVLEKTIETFEARTDLAFPQRLVVALRAGEVAGGDKRGRQSACLVVVSDQEYSDLDLRVDDHADPIGELARLEEVSRERWVHFRRVLPTRQDPVGITDRTRVEETIASSLAREAAEGP
ncbi:MAG TPA: DUF1028 domain-containing protein [Aestuariivirgaceae bacterium]|nr:DUF1028 domain-containing protein [Aestuariivirgaceae bacterium]